VENIFNWLLSRLQPLRLPKFDDTANGSCEYETSVPSFVDTIRLQFDRALGTSFIKLLPWEALLKVTAL
jgi:hypothetical protein